MLSVSIPQPSPTEKGSPLSRGLTEAAAALLPDVLAVVAAVLGVGRDHPDAQDAASETMRRAVEGHERLRAGDPLRPWLMGIGRHVAKDARRARGRTVRRLAAEAPTEGPTLLDQVPTGRPGPFEQLAQARTAERVRQALTTLPEGPRQALTLFHLEGLGYDEITRRLGVPMGTVATWVSRGRKALLSELAAEGALR